MPTLGTTSKPGNGWHAYSGTTQVNREAELFTLPGSVRILELGQWVGGWSGTCRLVLGVWDYATKELLARTAQITVASEGAGGPAGSNVALYTEPLLAPLELNAGAQVLVGFARHGDDGHQVSTGGSGTGPHYHGRLGGAFNPDGDFDNGAGDYSEEVRRIGAYIADYEDLATAWVRRSGAWVRAESVQVRRSGAWVQASSIQARRSGSWTDAS